MTTETIKSTLVNFLAQLARRKRHECIDLFYDDGCHRLAIVLVGKRDVINKHGRHPYVMYILNLLRRDCNTIYLLCRGELNVMWSRRVIADVVKKEDNILIYEYHNESGDANENTLPCRCFCIERVVPSQ
jgi:hypothetical protein